MLYWFFVKTLGPVARRRFHPVVEGVENIPKQGGAIIASNHLAVIDDALLPLSSPRMIHFMGKAEYFNGKGIKGRFKKWWFTSVGVFPVDRSGGSKALGALETARHVLEAGNIFGIHPEGTRSPDGRLFRGHTGVARLAYETGAPIIPTAIIGSRELQRPGTVIPGKGNTKVVFGKAIQVPKTPSENVTREQLRQLTDRMMQDIRALSGQEYVDMYAQVLKNSQKKG
ncbi:MAG: lysophospholipid acyltransferase family protein [Bifidobacterium crudilactis]|uniref:lysophospholipid acyltransferase family protein n=1 Tax=Bifidobacterium crudilactis TaxID=327277 RepID=UPI0023524D07|nr:1-acyl-sn-glycerol-3-phosphate acyltransferase [Bifidobacterium crudilactis]MCI1637218.1 1-acyl-sn-glycerol-3-phosphate acyltransferase [Bifidobacterium crudilactis]MCI1643441.1 1-acyl-sn-glycerol-3-phosphate acyltransferase [Bifidobacterium crudilactis]MCI1889501.1 1-acyl-sn-glycerol-3-phosphate acyltransferase [Bifidobacterium crudilactis]